MSNCDAITRDSLAADLATLGLRPGDTALVHSAFGSVGTGDPEAVVGALLDVLGRAGTLLMPALTYLQEPRDVHDARHTPTCVGYLTEYFRMRPGTRRSLHPTHSVCAVGARADELLADHLQDNTPCGRYSPFNRLTEVGGRILMLGCGLRPNTTMHAIEEHARPPYLFDGERLYTITDMSGRTFRKTYTIHGFRGYAQRYDRAGPLLSGEGLRTGRVGVAASYLLDAAELRRAALSSLRADPLYFVEESAENH